MPTFGQPGYPVPSSSSSSGAAPPGLRNFLKRPVSPSSESSASKRAVSEGNNSPSSDSEHEPLPQQLQSPTGELVQGLRLNPGSSYSPNARGATAMSQQALRGGAHAVLSVSGAPPTPPLDDDIDDVEDTGPKQPRPEPAQQLATIKGLADAPLRKGDCWFVLPRAWYKRWQAACTHGTEGVEGKDDVDLANITVEDVGPIDNRPIAGEWPALRPGLVVGADVEVLPQTAAELLADWYGLVHDLEHVRTVIAPGGPGTETVELYPPIVVAYLVLQPAELPPSEASPPFCTHGRTASLADTVGRLKAACRFALHIPDGHPVRLWRFPTPSAEHYPATTPIRTDGLPGGAEPLDVSDTSDLNEAMLTEPLIHLGIEVAGSDGKFAEATSGSSAAATAPFGGQEWLDKMERQNEANFLNPRYKSTMMNGVPIAPSDPTAPAKKQESGIINRLRSSAGFGARPLNKVRGLTGLSNLGNTCFMNSALQCMSNCPELKQYFISGVYRSELNPINPLGMGGKVAEAFGQLIERLWDPRASGAIAPREFKSTIGRFASQFLGYGQQDSQELLAFLLDALHEDLNRVKQKPFDEIPDWNGGGEEELMRLAETCWELYKRRNDSVIVDLFQGQYKSTLVCPVCSKVAIKFDPVLYLTLALPSTRKYKGKFWFVPLDITKPKVPVEFEVPVSASMREVKRHLGKILSADSERMAMVEDFRNKPWKVWQDTESVDSVNAHDVITVYETPEPFATLARTSFTGDGHLLLPVMHSSGSPDRSSGYSKYSSNKGAELFGPSFIIALSPEEASTYDGIYDAIAKQYARRMKTAHDLYDQEDQVEEAEGDGEEADGAKDKMDVSPRPDKPTSDAKRFRRDIFQIRVPTRPLVGKFPTSNSISGPTESLKDRAHPLAASTASTSAHALPGSFQQEDAEDLYGDGPSSTTIPVPAADDASATAPPPAQPLVVPGDWIECNWSAAAFKHFFGANESERWSEGDLVVDPDLAARSASSKKKQAVSIEDCLRDLRTPELLGEDDMWRCPDCKDFRQATKTMQIWKAPDILVVHLKRFSSARTSYGRSSKIESMVDFPIEGLDLSEEVEGVKVARRLQKARREGSVASEGGKGKNDPMIVVENDDRDEEADESLIYDLFGVSNHFGGLGGGHYTAFAKNEEDGLWHNYDDSQVSLVTDPERIKSPAAYLLFYRRRTSRVLGPKTHDIVSSAIQSRSASAAPSERGASPAPVLQPKSAAQVEPADNDLDQLPDDDGDVGGIASHWFSHRGAAPAQPARKLFMPPEADIAWGGAMTTHAGGTGDAAGDSSPASSTGAQPATPESLPGSAAGSKFGVWEEVKHQPEGEEEEEQVRLPTRTRQRGSRMVLDDEEEDDHVVVGFRPVDDDDDEVHEVQLD